MRSSRSYADTRLPTQTTQIAGSRTGHDVAEGTQHAALDCAAMLEDKAPGTFAQAAHKAVGTDIADLIRRGWADQQLCDALADQVALKAALDGRAEEGRPFVRRVVGGLIFREILKGCNRAGAHRMSFRCLYESKG